MRRWKERVLHAGQEESTAMRPKEMNDVKAITALTYNSAADLYDAPALSFWDRIGRRTVQQLSPQPGAWVLDACCGSGASAIPTALAVGPNGRVLGVDLAENLLQLGRNKAARLGLSHGEFQLGDIEALDPARETFDAVVCVLGIFFLSDMSAGVRHLWRFVRPGGQMAITTWGPRVLEPASSIFWLAVRDERPDLYKGYNPWDRINEPAALASMLLEGGVKTAKIAEERDTQPLNSPEEFWTVALGSGYRSVIEQLDIVSRERVRQATLDSIRKQNVRSIEANAIYAVARKP